MLTVKEVLQNKVTLNIECVDRVYLNGYVKNLLAWRGDQLHSEPKELAHSFTTNDEEIE
ncbi:MAG: hypothetical protein KJ638_05660 [Chloroflexi bacterium]|nr:hypothetical protein [Chloroflexota bacterium]